MQKKILFILLLFPIFIFGQKEKYSKVEIKLSGNILNQISELGIPVEGQISKDKWIYEFKQSDLDLLSKNNIPYKVLIEDVEGFYQVRNYEKKEVVKNNKNIGCNSSSVDVVKPNHYKHGSLAGYLTLAEIYQELDSMHLLFPSLTSARAAIDTFHTAEGRSIYFLKISKNANLLENEPRVLYTSLTHAREPMGMQQLIWFMWYMLENYGVDEEITYILNHTELYFIPCSNPDGYFYNETTNPNGGGMWRKNRRDNGDGNFGVDLNRNWGYQWGYDDQGSSPTTSSDVYRGPSAFSENETKAIKWLTENRSFALAIDHHCYSNILLFPWGYQNFHSPDHDLFVSYSKKMTKDNQFAYGTPGELLYTANGGTFDWYYGEQTSKNKIIALSPEAGTADDGFWPIESRIDEIALDFFNMNLYLARFAIKYGEVEDKSPNILNNLEGSLSFDFVALGLDTNAVFKVSYLPVTQNITSFGNAVSFSNPNLNQSNIDQISYQLNSNIVAGDEIIFVISLQIDQLITYKDTIRKIFGQPEILFSDSCNNLSNWTSAGGSWVSTNTSFVSPSFSICDSYGNYSANQNKRITLNNAVNLSQTTWAQLSFYARWDLEKSYDFVKLEASIDNGISWDALCGKYTVMGSEYQEQGKPCYDGTQTAWVLEEINLFELLGYNVLFRFVLKSDAMAHGDGFYFDDFKVNALLSNSTQINKSFIKETISIYPNPNKGIINCSIEGFDAKSNYVLVLFDALGNEILKSQINQSSIIINSNNLSGIYFASILKNNNPIYRTKLICIP